MAISGSTQVHTGWYALISTNRQCVVDTRLILIIFFRYFLLGDYSNLWHHKWLQSFLDIIEINFAYKIRHPPMLVLILLHTAITINALQATLSTKISVTSSDAKTFRTDDESISDWAAVKWMLDRKLFFSFDTTIGNDLSPAAIACKQS